MSINKVSENLYIIVLEKILPNFRFSMSPWVYKDEEICFLIDPGPLSTNDILKKGLDNLKITKDTLDFILLTHIHMDHAGGTGALLTYYPKAHVICHPRGIPHLLNPEKLWEGSRKTFGPIAEAYGKIPSISSDRIEFQEKIANNKIKAIETLGHSPHHLSFLFKKYLFIGEAAGFHFPIGNHVYLRPATPPIFNYDIAISSIDKLLDLNLADYKICYAHYGMSENAELMLKIAKDQLTLWTEVISNHIDKSEQKDFIQQIIIELQKKDKYFANINLFDEDTRKKEEYFVGNSIRGIVGYISKKKKPINNF